jgi:hypothetical protein
VVHAPPPQPEPPVSPPPPSHADIWQKHVDVMLGEGMNGMTKAQGDASYAAAMNAAYDELQENVKNKVSPHTAMQQWKLRRSHAMAAWAQAVHGTPFNPAPVAVYKADLQLYNHVEAGTPQQVNMEYWKKNTDLEKKGLFPPGATPPAPPVHKPTLVPADTALPAAVPVKPIDYASLVPDDHVPIGPDDFLKKRYSARIEELNTVMAQDGLNAQTNKTKVENALRKRLADKPNFQALVQRLGLAKSGISSLEAKLIGAWASSSGDSRDISCALQMAVKDAFNVPDGAVHLDPLQSLKSHGKDVNALSLAAANQLQGDSYGKKPFTSKDAPTIRAAFQEFVQAQHAETQAYFKAKGIKHVYVARGMNVKANSDHNKIGPSSLTLQPASSFSSNYSTSRSGFSSYGNSVFLCKVPVEQVLGTYHTGYGCTGEHELVVIGHAKLKTYPVPYEAGGNSQAAEDFVRHQLLQGK